MSTILVPLSRVSPRIRAGIISAATDVATFVREGSALLAALNCFGDPLDATQPGVPGGADRGQLRDRAGELGLVHFVEALASGRRDVDQPDPVKYAQVLGDRLPRDRQLLTQRGRRAAAVGQQQVEHPPPGRVPHRRPELVVDGDAHGVDTSRATYVTRRGMK